MNRNLLRAAACALSFAAATAAGAAETMPLAQARAVTDQTIDLVESKGLYPRRQEEYAQAKQDLLAAVDGKTADVDRNDLYARIRKVLETLDTGGHSFVFPPRAPGQSAPPPPAGPGVAPFQHVATSRGTVLRWVPPATTDMAPAAMSAYVRRVYDDAAAVPDVGRACALVVDLSEQTGGNAWPPFIAMYPLFGNANKARMVDRDGKAIPFVDRTTLASIAARDAGDRANPFAPFATGPLAVLVGPKTASAGEMLLVALMGEERVRTFGQTSYGMSTANRVYWLPDGAMLLLTEMRYAVGDGPVFRGGIAPMQPAPKGESADASLKTAAEWAAANSPRCAPR
ncbi:S41 family peptidase [Massilia kyonggiensis]|nr:S41 family peptidase [Massilia kyonggiensis]